MNSLVPQGLVLAKLRTCPWEIDTAPPDITTLLPMLLWLIERMLERLGLQGKVQRPACYI